MTNEIIIAGFGGQGVLLMGQLLTYAGMIEGKNVSWLPSYGPEMRGGTANCNVIVSDEPVGSPVVTEADSVVAFNKPSLDKFERFLKPGGKLFINSSLIDKKPVRSDIEIYYIPASDTAMEIGNIKVLNVVMLGALLAVTKAVKRESIVEALKKTFGEKKASLIAVNEKALCEGAKLIE